MCQTVNYTRTLQGRYTIDDPQGIIRTRNYFLQMNKEFEITKMKELKVTAEYKEFPTQCQGLEDCRLFEWKGEYWVSCTTNGTSSYPGQISLGHINLDTCEIDRLIPLPKPYPNRWEKNWIPFSQLDCENSKPSEDMKESKNHENSHDEDNSEDSDELILLYSSYPLTLYSVETTGEERKMRLNIRSDLPPKRLDRLRGGSNPISFEFQRQRGSLDIEHECIEKECRYYVHRFVWRDEEKIVKRISKPFTFCHMGVEFCAGLCWSLENDYLIATISLEDHESRIVGIEISTVRDSMVIEV